VPSLEAELYDGSDVINLVWLGRRRIAGIEPGRIVCAYGLVSFQDGRKVMFNPRYDLRALIIGCAVAVVLLAIRIVQRSTPQFVVNSLVGIGVAALFAMRSGRAEDAFVPGMLLNTGYAVVMTFTILVRWPLIGFLIGSVTGDPVGWRADPGIVRLCSRLTWLFVAPCVIRVAVQFPLWLVGEEAVLWLGIAKIALGWPLQVGAMALMVWVLMRGRTPIRRSPA
jgi:hypothetical protein